MLSSVLKSERAIQVNIAIMRSFVKIREMLSAHKDLARKLEEMEKKYDSQFRVVFDAIRQLMTPPEKTKRKIGFGRDKDKRTVSWIMAMQTCNTVYQHIYMIRITGQGRVCTISQ